MGVVAIIREITETNQIHACLFFIFLALTLELSCAAGKPEIHPADASVSESADCSPGRYSDRTDPAEGNARKKRSDQRMLCDAFSSDRRRAGGSGALRSGHPPPLGETESPPPSLPPSAPDTQGLPGTAIAALTICPAAPADREYLSLRTRSRTSYHTCRPGASFDSARHERQPEIPRITWNVAGRRRTFPAVVRTAVHGRGVSCAVPYPSAGGHFPPPRSYHYRAGYDQ